MFVPIAPSKAQEIKKDPTPPKGIRVTCAFAQEDGKRVECTADLLGNRIRWIRFFERKGTMLCEVTTDEKTQELMLAHPTPSKITLGVTYGDSIEKRKKTATGIWCLPAAMIDADKIDAFFKDRENGAVIKGDVGQVLVTFTNVGVTIRSEMTSTHANYLRCGWRTGFVILLLFRDA